MLLLFKDYVTIGIGIIFPMYSKGKYQLSSVIGLVLYFDFSKLRFTNCHFDFSKLSLILKSQCKCTLNLVTTHERHFHHLILSNKVKIHYDNLFL